MPASNVLSDDLPYRTSDEPEAVLYHRSFYVSNIHSCFLKILEIEVQFFLQLVQT